MMQSDASLPLRSPVVHQNITGKKKKNFNYKGSTNAQTCLAKRHCGDISQRLSQASL